MPQRIADDLLSLDRPYQLQRRDYSTITRLLDAYLDRTQDGPAFRSLLGAVPQVWKSRHNLAGRRDNSGVIIYLVASSCCLHPASPAGGNRSRSNLVELYARTANIRANLSVGARARDTTPPPEAMSSGSATSRRDQISPETRSQTKGLARLRSSSQKMPVRRLGQQTQSPSHTLHNGLRGASNSERGDLFDNEGRAPLFRLTPVMQLGEFHRLLWSKPSPVKSGVSR